MSRGLFAAVVVALLGIVYLLLPARTPAPPPDATPPPTVAPTTTTSTTAAAVPPAPDAPPSTVAVPKGGRFLESLGVDEEQVRKHMGATPPSTTPATVPPSTIGTPRTAEDARQLLNRFGIDPNTVSEEIRKRMERRFEQPQPQQ